MSLVIDRHGHYTVLPKADDRWREDQLAAFEAGRPAPSYPDICDDEIREAITANQGTRAGLINAEWDNRFLDGLVGSSDALRRIPTSNTCARPGPKGSRW